jgi:hypothetical protein
MDDMYPYFPVATESFSCSPQHLNSSKLNLYAVKGHQNYLSKVNKSTLINKIKNPADSVSNHCF